MTLNKQQIKYLKKEAHQLKSIYQIGKLGVTDAFIHQLDQALERHELIKFNILQNSLEEIGDATQAMAQALGAHVIQTIGHTAVLYRPSNKEKFQQISNQVKSLG